MTIFEDKEANVMALTGFRAASASIIMAVSVLTATPLKLNPPFPTA